MQRSCLLALTCSLMFVEPDTTGFGQEVSMVRHPRQYSRVFTSRNDGIVSPTDPRLLLADGHGTLEFSLTRAWGPIDSADLLYLVLFVGGQREVLERDAVPASSAPREEEKKRDPYAESGLAKYNAPSSPVALPTTIRGELQSTFWPRYAIYVNDTSLFLQCGRVLSSLPLSSAVRGRLISGDAVYFVVSFRGDSATVHADGRYLGTLLDVPLGPLHEVHPLPDLLDVAQLVLGRRPLGSLGRVQTIREVDGRLENSGFTNLDTNARPLQGKLANVRVWSRDLPESYLTCAPGSLPKLAQRGVEDVEHNIRFPTETGVDEPEYSDLVLFGDFRGAAEHQRLRLQFPLSGRWVVFNLASRPAESPLAKQSADVVARLRQSYPETVSDAQIRSVTDRLNRSYGDIDDAPLFVIVPVSGESDRWRIYRDASFLGDLSVAGTKLTLRPWSGASVTGTIRGQNLEFDTASPLFGVSDDSRREKILLCRPELSDAPPIDEFSAFLVQNMIEFDNIPFRSFDITKLHVQTAYRDTGNQKRLFAGSSDDSLKMDFKRIFPAGLDLVPIHSGTGTSCKEVSFSESERKFSFSVMFGLQSESPVSAVDIEAGGGASSDHGEKRRTAILTTRSDLRSYSLIWDKALMELHKDFRDAILEFSAEVRTLGEESDEARARARTFLERWGTHYALGTTYGGLLVLSKIESSSEDKDRTSWNAFLRGKMEGGLRDGTAAKIAGKDTVGMKFGASAISEEFDLTGRENENISWFMIPSKTLTAQAEYISGEVEDPVPVYYDLRPIHDLLSPVFFEEPEVYTVARAVLRKAFHAYVGADAAPALDPVNDISTWRTGRGVVRSVAVRGVTLPSNSWGTVTLTVDGEAPAKIEFDSRRLAADARVKLSGPNPFDRSAGYSAVVDRMYTQFCELSIPVARNAETVSFSLAIDARVVSDRGEIVLRGQVLNGLQRPNGVQSRSGFMPNLDQVAQLEGLPVKGMSVRVDYDIVEEEPVQVSPNETMLAYLEYERRALDWSRRATPRLDSQLTSASRSRAPAHVLTLSPRPESGAPSNPSMKTLAGTDRMILVGSRDPARGDVVHTFERAGNRWVLRNELVVDPSPPQLRYGAMSTNGPWLVLGAEARPGVVRIFRRQGEGWRPFQTLECPEDVRQVVLGSPRERWSPWEVFGRPEAMRRTASPLGTTPSVLGWMATLLPVVLQDSGPPPERFGAAVDVEGSTLAVGVPGRRTVLLFRFDGSSWTRSDTLRSDRGGFGQAVDLSGSRLLVGAPRVAMLHELDPSSRTWVLEQTWEDENWYRESLALAGDVVAVSSHTSSLPLPPGSAAVWRWNGSEWHADTLQPERPAASRRSSDSIVATDGSTVLVGANGVVHAYQWQQDAWRELGEIAASLDESTGPVLLAGGLAALRVSMPEEAPRIGLFETSSFTRPSPIDPVIVEIAWPSTPADRGLETFVSRRRLLPREESSRTLLPLAKDRTTLYDFPGPGSFEYHVEIRSGVEVVWSNTSRVTIGSAKPRSWPAPIARAQREAPDGPVLLTWSDEFVGEGGFLIRREPSWGEEQIRRFVARGMERTDKGGGTGLLVAPDQTTFVDDYALPRDCVYSLEVVGDDAVPSEDPRCVTEIKAPPR